MKQVLSLLCIFLILLGSSITKPLDVRAIDDFWVEVSPRRVSSGASYRFHFSLQKKVKMGQWIAIDFPPGTTVFPKVPENEPERTQRLQKLFDEISISLKGGKHTLTTTKDGFLQIKFFVSLDIDPAYRNVQLEIPTKAGFVNPAKEGIYFCRIATEPEPYVKESEPFQIVESKLSVPVVSVDPPTTAKFASYKIEFVLGKGGALKKNHDYIQISFPIDTKITKSLSEIDKNQITINNIPLLVSPEGGGRLLKLLSPIDLMDATKVIVKIDLGAGIQNPRVENDYTLLVSTTTDTTWEKSSPYHIWEKEPVKPRKTKILSIVVTPNYAGAIATYQIDIQFGDNQIPGPGGWMKLDFSFREYSINFPISTSNPVYQEFNLKIPEIENPSAGSYFLKLSTNLEPEGVRSDQFAILPPLLKTTIELKEGILGNQNWFVKPPKAVLTCLDPTAQIRFWFDDKKDQTKVYQDAIELPPGEYSTTIHYYAVQGDLSEDPEGLLIKVDTVPPILEVLPIGNPLHSPVVISGKTEAGALLTIDQVPTTVSNQGVFSYPVSYQEIGSKCHALLIVDPAGNRTDQKVCYWFGCRILFQIGNLKVSANDVTEKLALAPFIKQEVTLIPFRYLGEKLQAKIDFTVDPATKRVKTIQYKTGTVQILLTIGEISALVNHKMIKLEIPPQIVKGTTVVPLRFVAEALSCKIEWEPKTQSIKLEFPVF